VAGLVGTSLLLLLALFFASLGYAIFSVLFFAPVRSFEYDVPTDRLTPLPDKKTIRAKMKQRGFASTVVGRDRSNGAKIYYKVIGNGSKRTVLCMGLGARGDLWQEINKLFIEEDMQLLILDNRGIGMSAAESTLAFGLYSIRMMAEDTLDVINHVGWQQFNVVGHSMGGMVALELSLLCRTRVTSLALVNTHAGGLGALPSGYCIGMKLKSMLRPKYLEHLLPDNMQLMHGSYVHSHKKEYMRIYNEKLRDKATYGKNGMQSFKILIKQLLAIAMHYISEERLRQLRGLPTLIVASDEDHLISPMNSVRLSKVLEAKFHMFHGCGHSVQREKPGKLCALISAHVKLRKELQ